MNNIFLVGWLLTLELNLISANLYMHSPRGSNNRINENTATRKNNNRLFDSQNNARGGYNVGDDQATKSTNENQQYRMKFYQSGIKGDSNLRIQWTNQHGCGKDDPNDPMKLNCNLVLQFKCQDDTSNRAPKDSYTLRNGQLKNSQDYTNQPKNENTAALLKRRNSNVHADRGLHETWEWYNACYNRERNKGLFTADQNLQKNNLGVDAAVATRQNPNKQRSGYECPEERDYYPYWHPTPWTDVAVLAHNSSICSYYKENSFNRRPYGECVEREGARRKSYSIANNPVACTEMEGEWVEYHSVLELATKYTTKGQCEGANRKQLTDRGIVYKWGKPYDVGKIVAHQSIEDACFVLPPPVECKVAEWSRPNNLGDGLDGKPLHYTWKLPHFPSLKQKRCVFRLRYNISTDDYAPWSTDHSENQVKQNNVVVKKSPVEQNPLVDIGANQALRLAINTAQFGRTFQDRSHVFFISPRPAEVADERKLINLNVRGKRGNIVQTYPAVEYDFVPKEMSIKDTDLVHIQWTGSNTHNNKAPGGDGQTGDAGEGTGGTDRHNLLELLDASQNFPRPIETASLYKSMNVVYNSINDKKYDTKNVAIQLASSGYYRCAKNADCGKYSIETKAALNPTIDGASPSYAGLITSFKKGTYHYVCTRNNNFTNRSQKGKLVVR